MRIILHAGANKTDDDRLLLSLRRNLNLHHQNKIALPLPKQYRRPLRQRMMQSNHRFSRLVSISIPTSSCSLKAAATPFLQ